MMADVSLVKVALALALGILLAGGLAVVLARMAAGRGGKGLFKAAFLTILCVYALGFAARYVLIEVLPAAGVLESLPLLSGK
ncbi:hypothetical protein [Solidesulfovibrio aerotolerans]|nr:hypothetical protein [Solidesulfovibrio aerotolerans]